MWIIVIIQIVTTLYLSLVHGLAVNIDDYLNEKRSHDPFIFDVENSFDHQNTNQSIKPYRRIRKEVRQLSSKELDRYFNTLWTYKRVGRQDGLNYFKTYDDIVAQHALASRNTTVDQAHVYAAFLIWHSVYVREFEIAIQSIDPTVSVPYWDWTLDSNLSKPSESVLFTADYFGSSDSFSPYNVRDGRMAYWNVSSDPLNYIWWESPTGYLRGESNYNPSEYVTRAVNLSSSRYPDQTKVNACLEALEFDDLWACIWGTPGSNSGQSELHGGVHGMTGGSWKSNTGDKIMGDFTDPETSPNDPIWFSHHAQLDRIFYQWQVKTGQYLVTEDDPCGIFYGDNATYPQPPGHNLNDVFYPYFYLGGKDAITIADGCRYLQYQNHHYTYDHILS